MAIFKEGDWVQITPTPDTRWEYWSTSHTALCGMLGQITEIELEPNSPNIVHVLVTIYDEDNVAIFQEWFREHHIILTTRYNKFLKDEMEKACDELQEWEKKKKKMLNDSLRRMFGLEDEEEETKRKVSADKKKSSTTQCATSAEDVEEIWEGDTEEYLCEDIDRILQELDELDTQEYDNAWKYPDGAD
tara:strand:+ start:1359 stop:1925 length:567 start_codon:yes stop_codon:yes gene_type:complete